MTWNEERFVGYVQEPTGWLRERLDDNKARGKMVFKVRKEQDAIDLLRVSAFAGAHRKDGVTG